jgi:hypothetical protein
MLFVSIMTVEQFYLQAIHRTRNGLISRRTRVINQIRSFLQDRGITVSKGPDFLRTPYQISPLMKLENQRTACSDSSRCYASNGGRSTFTLTSLKLNSALLLRKTCVRPA